MYSLDQTRHSNTVPPVFRVDFLCFLVFFVCSESYFLQYSSEKSQSWQECRQVTPHHNYNYGQNLLKVNPCCYFVLFITTKYCILLFCSAKCN